MDQLTTFDKTIGGEYNSISLHFCKFRQHVSLSQSLDVRSLKKSADSQVLELGSGIPELKNRVTDYDVIKPS